MKMLQKSTLFLTFLVLSSLFHAAVAQNTLYLQAKAVEKTANSPTLEQVDDYDLFELNSKAMLTQARQHATNTFELRLQFGSTYDWALVLEPAKVHGDDFKFVTQDGKVLEVEKNITYKGYLKHDPTTKVRMTISDTYIFGVVLDSDKHVFEMVKKTTQLTGKEVFAVYKSNQPSLQNPACEQHETLLSPNITQGKPPIVLDPQGVLVNTYCPKLSVVLDKQGLAKAGTAANFNTDLQTIINVVNGYYATFSVQYELNPVTVITASSNPWTDAPGNQSALVTNFATWGFANLTPTNYNCAMLFTGTNMNGIGYAFIGHMCPNDNSRFGEIDYQYVQPITQRANLTTHELGHLWGAQHSAQSSTLIMSPSIYDGNLQWDATTLNTISTSVNTTFNSCLPRCSKLAVTWTSPTNTQVFTNLNPINFATTAAADGSVTSVQFFVNNVSVGTDNTSPYTLTWTPPSYANYTLKAIVTDNLNATISSEIAITVQNGASTTVVAYISSSSDDAEESVSSGSVSLTSTDLELADETGANAQEVGMRFTTVNVPRGATITNAYIQFTVDETNSEAVTLAIYAEDKGNAPTFTTAVNNVSSRTKTTNPASWSPAAWTTIGAAGVTERTPNISSLIQKVVNRADWVANNALVLLINGTGTTKRVAHAYDFAGTSTGAPILNITYTTTAVVALEWLSIHATWTKDNAVLVEWKVQNEEPYTQYEIQRSLDGQHFTTIHTVLGKFLKDYSYLDTDVSTGAPLLYYRIKNEENGAKSHFSTIVSVKNTIQNTHLDMTAFPNPFSTSVNFVLDIPQTAPIQLTLFNAMGQQVITLIDETLAAGQHPINWSTHLPSGAYYLKMSDGKQQMMRKLVKTF